MKVLKNILTTLLLVITCSPLFAGNYDTAFVKEKEDLINLNQYLKYTSNKSNLPFDSIQILKNSEFSTTTSDNIPSFGFTTKDFWFKLTLKNGGIGNKKIFEIGFPFLDEIEVYIPSLGTYKKFVTGDHYAFKQRPIKHRNFLFPVTFYENEVKVIYVHVKSSGEYTAFPVSLIKQEKIFERDYFLLFLDGLYYGCMLFAFFLSLFLGLTLRERSQFFYLFYILGSFLFQFALDGLAYQYLFCNTPWLANHIVPAAGSFGIFWLLQFTNAFFKLKTLNKTFYKLLNVISVVLVFLHLASYLPSPYYAYSLLSTSITSVVANVSLLSVAIYCFRKNIHQAQYFLIAFSLLILAIIIVQLKNFGVLPANAFTTEAIQIGSLIEIILLTLALAGKVKTLSVEKEIAQKQLLEELKEKAIVQEQANAELEIKVTERTKELNAQKHIIEEKNRDITSAINYAKNIQYAILPAESYIKTHLPQSFILYKPKDIVSGDFYWFNNVNTSGENPINLNVIAACDCTGHGVPGAFMSIIGNNLLNETVKNPTINSPGDVLAYLNNNIGLALNKNNNVTRLNDGMDIAICAINSANNKLMYAGANRPLWIFKNSSQQIEEISATKLSIGGHSPQSQKYDDHSLQMETGDMIYIFSDGFADQFGGEKGKKLMTKNFKIFLNTIANKNPEIQHALLEKHIEDWKGNYEQVDDILVIGIRF